MSHKTLQKNISRLMALLLCLLLVLPCVPAAHAESGSCGDNLSWSFENATLTITGSGAMYDYSEHNKAPWDAFTEQIQKLSLSDSLTRIGDRAFYNCTALVAVTVPGSVMEIGDAAFCKNTSMAMLSLNSGLQTIGRSAFESCTSLQELRLPDTVTSIGNHAFYCCESLSYVAIPASVQSFGSGIFSYCTRLSRVDMDVPASDLPSWSFYGCDSLSLIHAQGTAIDASVLKQTSSPVLLNPQEDENQDVPEPTEADEETDPPIVLENGESVAGTWVERTENSIIANDIIMTQSGGSTEVNVDVSATVITPDGWNEVLEYIAILQGTGGESSNEGTALDRERTDVVIYIPDNSPVPVDVLKILAGTNTILTVNTSSGAKFRIDCTVLDAEKIKADLDLSYSLVLLDAVPDGIESSLAYHLNFNSSCESNIEVMIRLPQENARRAASLYQHGDEMTYNFVQSVVVDNDGYAHYYLASIDHTAQYLIAMDVLGEQSEQAIVPDDLYDEYHLVDYVTGNQYEVTGRKSSWGVNLGQVMSILAVVMVTVIVVVGVIMYSWNKQRLKKGYVPKWDDEDES